MQSVEGRFVRRAVIRSFIALLSLLAATFAAIAVGVYLLVGFGDSLRTQNLSTQPEELVDCTSILLDIENIEISQIPGDFILGNKVDQVSLQLQPVQDLAGIVVEMDMVEDLLLGRQTCALQVLDRATFSVNKISSGDQPIDLDGLLNVNDIYQGDQIVLPVNASQSRSIIVVPETQVTEKSVLILNGNVSYSQAPSIFTISAISATLLTLTALGVAWATRKRSNQDA